MPKNEKCGCRSCNCGGDGQTHSVQRCGNCLYCYPQARRDKDEYHAKLLKEKKRVCNDCKEIFKLRYGYEWECFPCYIRNKGKLVKEQNRQKSKDGSGCLLDSNSDSDE